MKSMDNNGKLTKPVDFTTKLTDRQFPLKYQIEHRTSQKYLKNKGEG